MAHLVKGAALLGALLLSLGACTASTTEPSSPSTSAAATAPSEASGSAFANLEPCPLDPDWRCGTVTVLLDREDPESETIEVAYFVLPHTDVGTPAAEPVFYTAGGPGLSAWSQKDVLGGIEDLTAHHDIVAIDARGTGSSGAIDCEPLQRGFSSLDELVDDVAACGEQLGDASDRYGGGDVAMDVDAVREALGLEAIDYYGASFSTVDAQAYAARFPERLHALVLDAGMVPSDAAMSWFWGYGTPEALFHVPSLRCDRDPACALAHADGEATLRRLAERLGKDPIVAHGAGGIPDGLVLDQTAIAALLAQVPVADLLDGAEALEDGDPIPLLRLALLSPPFLPGGDGFPTEFSSGYSAARYCNDVATPWDPNDPIPVRRAALDAALEAQPAAAFAPFRPAAWDAYWWFDMCLAWPAPDRLEPAVPAGTDFADVPTLVLAGDLDTTVANVQSLVLAESFPNTTYVQVQGAGHPVVWEDPSGCAAAIVVTFLDTLDAGDLSCAGPQPVLER